MNKMNAPSDDPRPQLESKASLQKPSQTSDAELRTGIPSKEEEVPFHEDRIPITAAESKAIIRKLDRHILVAMSWIWFASVSDKSVLGLSAVFGLKRDAGLVGNQYSMIGSMGYWPGLAMIPVIAYVLVKAPIRPFLSCVSSRVLKQLVLHQADHHFYTTRRTLILFWGIALCGMAASRNFRSLLAARFFVGLFESPVHSMIAIIACAFYRRSEQPLRMAVWLSFSGISTIVGAVACYGLGHIRSSHLYSYQIIFLTYGLITICSAPVVYWLLDNSPGEARCLTAHERLQAVERLRANQTNNYDQVFKPRQVLEALLEVKFWLFMGMWFCSGQGHTPSTLFGPLIVNRLIGFNSYDTMLLTIPLGALQVIFIFASCYLAYRYKTKWIFLTLTILPVVVGLALLYALPRTKHYQGGLLFGYYSLSAISGTSPLLMSWVTSNFAGSTKKATALTGVATFHSIGSIAGTYIFKSSDGPNYFSGLRATLIIWCLFIALVCIQALHLRRLNYLKAKVRSENGKIANLEDTSMESDYKPIPYSHVGDRAFMDLTDQENDEFVYCL